MIAKVYTITRSPQNETPEQPALVRAGFEPKQMVKPSIFNQNKNNKLVSYESTGTNINQQHERGHWIMNFWPRCQRFTYPTLTDEPKEELEVSAKHPLEFLSISDVDGEDPISKEGSERVGISWSSKFQCLETYDCICI